VLALTLAAPALADAASKSRARAFSSCEAVGDYARKHALRIVEPGGLPPRFGFAVEGDTPDGSPPGPDTAPQEGAVRDGDGVDYSTTNVQEEGVDEPDIVKTDGRHLYVMSASTLYVFNIGTGEPKLVGSLALRGYGHELLLSGDRVLALTTYWDDPVLQPQPAQFAPYPYPTPEPATRLFEIDVSDASAPKLLNTLTMEGYYVSARLRGSVARIVITTPPSPWPVEEQTEAEQRRAIRHTRLSTWMPDGVLRDRVRDKRRVRRIVACDDVRKPVAFSGPGMLTVLTVDLARGLKPLDSDSLMTDAQTIYASKRSLFVAAERWFDPTVSDPEQQVEAGRFTAIHKFALDSESAEYRASGDVRGFVLNQFSLSEHDGALRVATTDQPPWRANAEQRQSESFVTVLGEKLNELGRVGGLGRGERIFAVRFLGDRGYVVTFRQVDPLYTLDLSNPEKPTVRGELELLGFSSYLHPIGNDLLLGLGQDANEQGQTRGTQLSLFDVSDLSAPKRLHSQTLGESTSSPAEHDHHAFLYWPATKLTVVPLSAYRPEDQFNGAVGFRVDRDKGISELGRAEHEGGGTIVRSLVAHGRLLTVSDRGVLSSSLDTLAPGTFAGF
jgi:beta propeller domain-containing protein